MIPQPLQRLDRYYTHQSADISRPLLARIFRPLARPFIPYTLRNPQSSMVYAGYDDALAHLGLRRDVLKGQSKTVYGEPLENPEGLPSKHFLKWATYTAPDQGHMIFELGGRDFIMGICFAKRPAGDVVVDQMFAGNLFVHHTVNMNLATPGADAVRKALLDIAAKTVQDLRDHPKGSDARFSTLMGFVLRYIAADVERVDQHNNARIALVKTKEDLSKLSARFDEVGQDLKTINDYHLAQAAQNLTEVLELAEKTAAGLRPSGNDNKPRVN